MRVAVAGSGVGVGDGTCAAAGHNTAAARSPQSPHDTTTAARTRRVPDADEGSCMWLPICRTAEAGALY